MANFPMTLEELEAQLDARSRQAAQGLRRVRPLFGGEQPDVHPYFVRGQAARQAHPDRNPFILLLDMVSSAGYSVAGLVSGVTDWIQGEVGPEEPFIRAAKGLTQWWTGDPQARFTFQDWLTDLGWTPESIPGKVAKYAVGFGLDVALDPLSWMSLGISKAATKVGQVSLNRVGRRMLRGFRNRTFAREVLEAGGRKATREAVTALTERMARDKTLLSKLLRDLPEGKKLLLTEINEKAQQRLLPLTQGPLGDEAAEILAKGSKAELESLLKTTGRNENLLEDVLLAAGKPIEKSTLARLATHGLLDYADAGGVKWFGRTLIRSKTADKVGLTYDTLLSKYLVDPVARQARRAGQLLGKAPVLRRAAAGAADLKVALKRGFGKLFNYDMLLEDEYAKTIYRDFAKGRQFHRQDVMQGLLDMAAVKDDTGKFVRWINPDESRQLHRALHDMSYWSHPLIGQPERAAKIFKELPPLLQEKATRIRGLLDEILETDAKQGLTYEALLNYFPQKWDTKKFHLIQRIIDKQKRPVGVFDWWGKRRQILMEFDEAVGYGLDQNMFEVLYDRLFSSRDRALQHRLIQEFIDNYGHMRLDIGGREVLERLSPEARKARGITALDEAIEKAQGSPVRRPDLQAAVDTLRTTRERLTLTDIRNTRLDIRRVVKQQMRLREEIGESMTASAAAKAKAKKEIADLTRGLTQLDQASQRLVDRSINRYLKDKVKSPPRTPPPSAFNVVGKEIRGLETQVRHAQRDLLESFIGAVEGGHIQYKGDLDVLRKQLDVVKKPLKAPRIKGGRRAIPSVSDAEIDRHVKQLTALGMPEKQAREHGRALQEWAGTVQGAVEQYQGARKILDRWQIGAVSLDTPAAKAEMAQRFDQMEVIVRQLDGLEANYRVHHRRLVEDLHRIKEGQTPSLRKSVGILQRVQEAKAKRDALIMARRTLRSPEELTAWRRYLEDPKAVAASTSAPPAIVENVSAKTHELIRLPITRPQVEALEKLFQSKGLSKKAPDILDHVAGVRRWEDLSGGQARELLEMVRRRPQDLLGTKPLPVTGDLETLVPLPRLQSDFVFKWQGETVRPDKILVPKWAADAIPEILKKPAHIPLLSRMMRGYDWAQDLFRWSVTVPWFAFQFRNSADAALRTMFETGLASFKPRYLKEYLLTLFGSSRPIRTQFGELPRESIKQFLMEENIWRYWPARVDLQYGTPGNMVTEAMKVVAGPFAGKPNAGDVALLNSHRFFHSVDRVPVVGRLSKFFRRFTRSSAEVENAMIHSYLLNRLEAGWTLNQIAKRTREFMFSWEGLTNFERQVMRRLIPFYGFLRTAIPYTYQLVKEKPVIVGAIGDLRLLGGTDKDLAPLVPRFVQEAVHFKLPTGKGGRPQYVVLNNFLTIDWSRDWAMADTGAFLRAALGQLSPLMLLPLEKAFGKDLYFGRDIKDRQLLNRTYSDNPAIRPIYKWLRARPVKVGKQDYVAVDGHALHNLRSFVFGRIYSTLDQVARAGLASEETLLRLGTGIITYQIDESRERDLLFQRAKHMENEFKKARRMGDDVRAQQIWEEMSGR